MELYQKTGKRYLDFSANINPLGLDGRVKEKLQGVIDDIIYYPIQDYAMLKAKLAHRYDIKQESICLTNGISDGLFYLCMAILQKEHKLQAYGIAPGFSEYERCIKSLGGEYHTWNIDYSKDISFLEKLQLEEFIKQIPKGTNILFLCNPDNPSGRLLVREEINQLLKQIQDRDMYLIVDESFMDFVEVSQSVNGYLKEFEHLIVLHSFTKIFAMPGLRCGAIFCGDSRLSTSLKRLIPPWNINTPALVATDTYLDIADTEYFELLYRILYEERIYLQESLRALGFEIAESHANFIFFARNKEDKRDYARLLYDRGILIRIWEDGYYRIAIKKHEENQELIRALKEVLKNEKS